MKLIHGTIFYIVDKLILYTRTKLVLIYRKYKQNLMKICNLKEEKNQIFH